MSEAVVVNLLCNGALPVRFKNPVHNKNISFRNSENFGPAIGLLAVELKGKTFCWSPLHSISHFRLDGLQVFSVGFFKFVLYKRAFF